MAVPDFQTLMLPVLKQYADGSERPTSEARGPVAAQFELTDSEQSEMLQSGRQTRFANRLAWAHVYLQRAGLLERVRRGVYRITPRGREVLQDGPPRITISFLSRYPEFLAFRARSDEQVDGESDVVASGSDDTDRRLTPDELVREGNRRLRKALAADLLERVQNASPAFFESLVVELLVAMGYGGTQEDAASVVGRSGDGGIDGIIKEDRLGLESIYIQAKRWRDSASIGRPAIQQFAGALQGQRARKGVFITTAKFSRDAIDYARTLQTNIVLIDGDALAELMLDYGVGVTVIETIRILRVDEDYFVDE